MLRPTVLLASSDPSLTDSVGSLIDAIHPLRLVVAATIGAACNQVDREDVLLVVAHLDEGSCVTEVTRLLQTIAIAGRSTVTLVVSDRYHAAQALALLRLGVADYLARPLNP